MWGTQETEEWEVLTSLPISLLVSLFTAFKNMCISIVIQFFSPKSALDFENKVDTYISNSI
jgi:hypothetical protein